MCPLAITREKWNAKPPRWEKTNDIPITYVFTIFTNQRACYGLDACSQELQALQETHMNNELAPSPDIKFNFMVAPDGSVYEGRGWTFRPTLPKINGRLNKYALYIGMLGTYSYRTSPPEKMFEAHRRILKYGQDNYLIEKQYVHVFYNLLIDSFIPYIKYQEKDIIKHQQFKINQEKLKPRIRHSFHPVDTELDT